MNKGYVFLLVLLVSVAGCGKKKKKGVVSSDSKQSEMVTNVDIPVADEGVKSFFDDEVGQFTLADEQKAVAQAKENDFAWEDEKNQNFKAVLFEFDHYSIKPDQQEAVAFDIATIKKSLEVAKDKGVKPMVVIEGHACHSAGSSVYNLALSEKRAKVLMDEMVAQGIDPETIKIVGRGQEVPAIIDGKPVTGDKQAQALNRRDEVRVLFS